MKIAVIGGGSTYTPELLDGFVRHGETLALSEVVLMDSDPHRLDLLGNFCRRMLAKQSAAFVLSTTANLTEALQGADFVLTQIRVGGQAGRHQDIQLGLRHDLIGQETTGVGGFAKALRTIPVLLGMCREMQKCCPDAWLINFTNPSGLVTEALLKYGHARTIGLCNNPINLRLDAANLLGVPEERVELDYIGLNHLSWVRRIRVDGLDRLGEIIDRFGRSARPANMPEELDYHPEFLRALGAIPSSYLRYYYLTRSTLAGLKSRTRSRAEDVAQLEEELLRIYADPACASKPALLSQRGGANYSRAAVELVRAIARDSGESHVVNVRNGETLACLPADGVIEVPCRIDSAGARPLALEPPAPVLRGLIQHVKAYEELAVEAAIRRTRSAAILALVSHPLVADADLAVKLVDEIAQVHGLTFMERDG